MCHETSQMTMEEPAASGAVELGAAFVSPFIVAGIAGFVCYACSFGLVQIGRLDGNSIVYTALNVLAAALVLLSMLDQFNLASALTQVTWIAVGVVGLVRRRSRLPVLVREPMPVEVV